MHQNTFYQISFLTAEMPCTVHIVQQSHSDALLGECASSAWTMVVNLGATGIGDVLITSADDSWPAAVAVICGVVGSCQECAVGVRLVFFKFK